MIGNDVAGDAHDGDAIPLNTAGFFDVGKASGGYLDHSPLRIGRAAPAGRLPTRRRRRRRTTSRRAARLSQARCAADQRPLLPDIRQTR